MPSSHFFISCLFSLPQSVRLLSSLPVDFPEYDVILKISAHANSAELSAFFLPVFRRVRQAALSRLLLQETPAG